MESMFWMFCPAAPIIHEYNCGRTSLHVSSQRNASSLTITRLCLKSVAWQGSLGIIVAGAKCINERARTMIHIDVVLLGLPEIAKVVSVLVLPASILGSP